MFLGNDPLQYGNVFLIIRMHIFFFNKERRIDPAILYISYELTGDISILCIKMTEDVVKLGGGRCRGSGGCSEGGWASGRV